MPKSDKGFPAPARWYDTGGSSGATTTGSQGDAPRRRSRLAEEWDALDVSTPQAQPGFNANAIAAVLEAPRSVRLSDEMARDAARAGSSWTPEEWDAINVSRPFSAAAIEAAANRLSDGRVSSQMAADANALEHRSWLAREWDAIDVSRPFSAAAIEAAVNQSGESSGQQTTQQAKGYALPDTTLGRAAAGAAGEAHGAFETVIGGPAQFLAHTIADIYPSNWPGYEFFQSEKARTDARVARREAAFRELTREAQSAASVGEIAGGIGGALALPQSKAAEGANLINRMIAAGKTGAVIGAAQPVQDAENFWSTKTLQTGISALGASLFQPIAEGAGKVAGYAADKALDIGRRVMNWAGGNATDKAVADVMTKASPELKQAVNDAVKSGQQIDRAALGRQVEADSLPVKISLTPGQARQDPIAISNELNFRSKNQAIVYKLQDQNRALVENLNHIRDTGAPDAVAPDAITAGENLIQAGRNTIEAQRGMTSALYKKLADANGGNLPVDGVAFVDSAEQALKRQMKGAFLPGEIRNIMEGFKSGEQQMTFENFENLRTILASAARTAERSGDGNAAGAIHLVRDALEQTPIRSDVAGVKQLADAARASAKFGFDMLRDNPALKAIDSGHAADNTFVQRYIIGASKRDITSLAAALQHDPVALQTIKAGTINYLKQAAGVANDNGNFTQAGYNKALQALGPKLEVIFGPEEAAMLRTVGNVARYTQLAPKGAYVNTSNTDVANLARSGADVAAGAVDRATGTPIGTIAKRGIENIFQRRQTAAEMGRILGPGAGISRPSAANDYLMHKLPLNAAQTLRAPLAVTLGGLPNKAKEKDSGK